MWVLPISKVFLLTALPGLTSSEQQEFSIVGESREVVVGHLRPIFVQAQPGARHRELENRKSKQASRQPAQDATRLQEPSARPSPSKGRKPCEQ